MSKKNEAWGIEVGAQAIKVLKLERSGSNVVLEDFEVLPFKQVLTTPDLNVEEAIRVNLESLAQKYEFEKSTVVVSVPGHMAFARFAKLPPIEANKVKSIVAYEAQQQIPFPIEEVEWDYQVFAQEDAPDIEVGIFAITKERVAHFLSNYRTVGLGVDALTLSPVAVYNAFAYDSSGSDGSTVYLDIGTVSTDIIVVEDGGIWLRTLPLGGNHFTNALMKQFKISFAKAEKLKLEAGTSKYAKQIFQAMRGVFSDLVSEIQRSLGFYQSLNRDAELNRIVGVGSTWKLPGLQKFLTQNLQMEVVRPDGFSRLEVDGRRAAEFSSSAVNMATAYGLALQGLGLGEVDANILPQTILKQRMWKAKTPWFVGAAACVAGAGVLFPVMQMMAGASFDGAWSETAQRNVKDTIRDAQNLKDQYDTEVVANDPRPGIRNYRRSFDYANLYPRLLSDVAEAMATIPPNAAIQNLDLNDPGDVQAMAAIPRKQRDQVWITAVTTEYVLPQASSASSGFGGAGGGGFDQGGFEDGGFEDGGFDDGGFDQGGFDQGGFDQGFTGGGGTDNSFEPGFAIERSTGDREQEVQVNLKPIPFPSKQAQGDSFDDPYGDDSSGDFSGEAPASAADSDKADETSPRIIVTVRGETTMDGSAISAALLRNFVGWMQQNVERPDRPYVLVPELTNTQFVPRGNAAALTGPGGTPTGALGGNTTGNDNELRRTPKPKTPEGTGTGLSAPGVGVQPGGPGIPGVGFPGGFDGPNISEAIEIKTPEGWYTTLSGQQVGFSINALIPRRPLSVEDQTQDHLFTFQFEVLLLPPDEARKTILPAPETTDEEDEQAPDNTTAGQDRPEPQGQAGREEQS